MYKRPQANTLYCFSPAVMLITIIVELSLTAWVLTRYVLRTPQRIIVALLVFLTAFQIAEFNVCAVHPVELIWSRMGYAFITLLPALALDLVIRLRRDTLKHVADLGYAIAALFIVGFALLPSALNEGVCTGNYVIFLLSQPLSMLYGLYYIGLETLGLALAFFPAPTSKPSEQSALRWMGIGYLAIMIPSLIIYIVLPAAKVAIPSIMCGFAILFALILGLRVAPLVSKTR